MVVSGFQNANSVSEKHSDMDGDFRRCDALHPGKEGGLDDTADFVS
jgi:hypothetical protein